jgi:hypothetical protein
MEGRVEDRNLRHFRSASHGYLDAQEVGWIVQRCKRRKLPDGRDHPIIDQTGLAKGLTPVNDPMSDREQLGATPYHSGVSEQIGDSVEGCGVVRQLAHRGILPERSFSIPLAVNEPAAQVADALGGASCEQHSLVHVEELVLERGASGVENQNSHDWLSVD